MGSWHECWGGDGSRGAQGNEKGGGGLAITLFHTCNVSFCKKSRASFSELVFFPYVFFGGGRGDWGKGKLRELKKAGRRGPPPPF